jgi:hypothetical protein
VARQRWRVEEKRVIGAAGSGHAGKRFGILLITGLLAIPALTGIAKAGPRQQQQRPAQAQQNQVQNQQQQQNRVQQLIADVYVNKFQNTLGLSDEQFLRVGTSIRQFIQTQFRVANQRNILNQRRTQLLEQTDPPEAEVRQLSEDTAQLQRTVGNMETNFVARIQAELTNRQILLVRDFNSRFFEEELPKLIETVRAEVEARGRTTRPNANRQQNNPSLPGNALRQNRQGQN